MNLIYYNKYCIEYNNTKCEKYCAYSADIKIAANLYNSSNFVSYTPYIAAWGIDVDENFDGLKTLSGRIDKAHAVRLTLH